MDLSLPSTDKAHDLSARRNKVRTPNQDQIPGDQNMRKIHSFARPPRDCCRSTPSNTQLRAVGPEASRRQNCRLGDLEVAELDVSKAVRRSGLKQYPVL